jgi:hypothetical protein
VSVVSGRAVEHDVVALDGAMIVLESTFPEGLHIKTVTLAVLPGEFETGRVKLDRRNPSPEGQDTSGWLFRGGADSDNGDASFQGLETGRYTGCVSARLADETSIIDCKVVEIEEGEMKVLELAPA